LWRGGDTYVIGQGMARAIEMALGRKTLGTTLTGGGARFFELYAQAVKMLPGFPAFGEGFDADLAAASGYLETQRELWRLRREARASHLRGDFLAASTLLRRLLDMDGGDPTAAYNLACALARRGDRDGALEWLAKAVDLGYSDRGFIEADSDLDSIRDAAGYRRLMERMAASGAERLRTSTP
jgi:tetratricopeptide (TPR) repeat protein